MDHNLPRKFTAEFIGTMFLLATVVGSGIMAERLADGNGAVALLANTVATGAVLLALILTFGPISGAHFNPAVTLCDAFSGGIRWRDSWLYLAAQVSGAVAGVLTANLMFSLPAVFVSVKVRTGPAQWFAEFIATFGLLSVIWGTSRSKTPNIYNGGLLVHVVDIVRKSRCNTGSYTQRHVCWNPASRCSRLYDLPNTRCIRGYAALPMAFAAAQNAGHLGPA
jgi:glycerol uptake facilitator-like aquaporin